MNAKRFSDALNEAGSDLSRVASEMESSTRERVRRLAEQAAESLRSRILALGPRVRHVSGMMLADTGLPDDPVEAQQLAGAVKVWEDGGGFVVGIPPSAKGPGGMSMTALLASLDEGMTLKLTDAARIYLEKAGIQAPAEAKFLAVAGANISRAAEAEFERGLTEGLSSEIEEELGGRFT